MAVRSYEYRDDSSFKTYKTWKNLEDISINLSMAVIVAEDARFASHSGFDFVEIKNAVEDAQRGKKLRGASTISQQTAKNVFCYPSDGWIRKGFEAYFTFLIEKIWGKRRILEVYFMLDILSLRTYNNRGRSFGPESILDVAGCVGGRETNV